MSHKTREEILVDVELAYLKAIQTAAQHRAARSREGAIYEAGKAVALAQILLENVLLNPVDVASKVDRQITDYQDRIDPVVEVVPK